MKFSFCPDCGAKLVAREVGDEGLVPWCEACGRPWFDMFPTCVIALVSNSRGQVLLLRQDYIHPVYRNLVSGYITPGESAEECVVREIAEETGLHVAALRLAGTWWFAKKEMLMVGFMARVDDGDLRLSAEVDDAGWVSAAEALQMVHPAGSVSHALVEMFVHSDPFKAC